MAGLGAGLLWCGILLAVWEAFRIESANAVRQTANLAWTLEAQMAGRVAGIDATLRFAQDLFRRDPAGFAFGDWFGFGPDADVTQGAIIRPDGFTWISRDGIVARPTYLGDRSYVAELLAAPLVDRLTISPPLVGRASGLATVNFARPLRDAAGAFAGIVMLSVRTDSFSRLYRRLDLAEERISLVGLDGIVRGLFPGDPDRVGASLPEAMLAPFRAGVAQVSERVASPIDGVERFGTLRRVEGYPLVVAVTIPAEAALARARLARSLLFGAGALLTLLIGIACRATLQKRAAGAEAHAAIEDTLANLGQGAMLIDPDGRILVANHQVAELLGLPPGLARPGRKLAALEAWLAQAGGPRRAAPDAVACPAEYIRPDGRVVEIRTAPVAGGRQVRTVTEVTAARRAADAIAAARDAALAAQAALTGALEEVPHGVMLIGADDRLELINPRAVEMLDIPPELVRPGITVEAYIAAQAARGDYDHLPGYAVQANATLRERFAGQPRYERTTHDGRVLEVRTTILADRRIVRTFTDITARQAALQATERARLAAEAALRSRAEFLGIVGHELRTPLNAIIGFADLLRGSGLPAAQAGYLGMIATAGAELLTIVNDVMAVARLERGQLTLLNQAFDPRAVLRATADWAAPRAAAKELELVVRLDARLPGLALGDEGRLREVVLKLLDNALKFTRGGTVTLAATLLAEDARAHRIGISVSDTGIGIAPEAQARMFDSFVQADSSSTRHFGGTGLGLAMSRLLLEAMGGCIAVESAIGEGSTFRLELPLQRASEPALG